MPFLVLTSSGTKVASIIIRRSRVLRFPTMVSAVAPAMSSISSYIICSWVIANRPARKQLLLADRIFLVAQTLLAILVLTMLTRLLTAMTLIRCRLSLIMGSVRKLQRRTSRVVLLRLALARINIILRATRPRTCRLGRVIIRLWRERAFSRRWQLLAIQSAQTALESWVR